MSNLKERLKNGETILGTMINSFDHHDIVRILKVAGFDMFIIDNEQGCMDYGKVSVMLSLARAIGISGFVRVPEVEKDAISKYMELGADGLLIPNCEDAEEVKKVIEYSKYAPMGKRGVSLFRPHTGFENIASGTEYMKKQNEETMIICQIESRKGIENVEEILKIDGVDVAFIGPNDLSCDLGCYGDMGNPELNLAIDKVISAAEKYGKYSGIFVGGAADGLKKWLDKGMKVNIWSSDTAMMMNYAKNGIATIKSFC